jgi:hypothetical protein
MRHLLFVHGIKNADPGREWLNTLNRSLKLAGTATVEERGYQVHAPSYLDLLEAEEEPSGKRPTETYKRASDHDYSRAMTRYWLALQDLEECGIKRHEVSPNLLAKLPADGVHANALIRLVKDAERYRRSPARRNAILQRVVAELPESGELVMIAHSLGSVVARDLIYHLPPQLELRLFITIGTPLVLKPMREHLTEANRRFPYETIGPWINLVGAGDTVTGHRGLSQVEGQALDLFIDTGMFPAAHYTTSYLDHPAVTLALDWVDARKPEAVDERMLPDISLPASLLALVMGAQYGLRVGQAIQEKGLRNRYLAARDIVLARLASQAAEAGLTMTASELGRDNAAWLRTKTVSDDELVSFLLSALVGNPVTPFEMDIPREARVAALEQLARDLGKPKRFATTIAESEQHARRAHKESRITLKRAALAVAGVAVVMAAPALVLAVAPAGLAGGAAIVGGLAALGPGGMLGGVGIVSALGGAGGLTAGRALMAGTAAQVEETVVFLQAFARSRNQLQQGNLAVTAAGHAEWYALIEMEDVAADDYKRLSELSDKDAPSVRELQKKLRAIDRALDWLRVNGLSPLQLVAGLDD